MRLNNTGKIWKASEKAAVFKYLRDEGGLRLTSKDVHALNIKFNRDLLIDSWRKLIRRWKKDCFAPLAKTSEPIPFKPAYSVILQELQELQHRVDVACRSLGDMKAPEARLIRTYLKTGDIA